MGKMRQTPLGALSAKRDTRHKQVIRAEKAYSAQRALEAEASAVFARMESAYPTLTTIREFLRWEVRLAFEKNTAKSTYAAEQLIRGCKLLLSGQWLEGKNTIDYVLGTTTPPIPNEPPTLKNTSYHKEQLGVDVRPHVFIPPPTSDSVLLRSIGTNHKD